MPHSEAKNTMTSQVNGETRPRSAFLSHLKSYPVISDSITTITSNPYGAKSLAITTNSVEKISKPFLPYLRTPISYITPYAARVDSLGKSTLSTIESRFPVVKKPTEEIYADGMSVVFLPLRKGFEGKDFILGIYSNEKKKTGGDGLVNYGKAALATGLVVSSKALSWLNCFLASKTNEAKEVKNEKLGN